MAVGFGKVLVLLAIAFSISLVKQDWHTASHMKSTKVGYQKGCILTTYAGIGLALIQIIWKP